MIRNKKWIALFSQTGSEIVNISEIIEKTPDLILTNNLNKEQWHPKIHSLHYATSNHDGVMNILRNYEKSDCFITLHGYLRIIPFDVCLTHNIFNGHPAPIDLYPELKGKDKQEDQYRLKEKYTRIGAVIHRVTPILDAGEIVISINEQNTLTSIDDSYNTLKRISLDTWTVFFSEFLQGRIN